MDGIFFFFVSFLFFDDWNSKFMIFFSSFCVLGFFLSFLPFVFILIYISIWASFLRLDILFGFSKLLAGNLFV